MKTLTPILKKIVGFLSLFLAVCLISPLMFGPMKSNIPIPIKVYLLCFSTILLPVTFGLLYKYFKRIILDEINKQYNVGKIYHLEITEDNE